MKRLLFLVSIFMISFTLREQGEAIHFAIANDYGVVDYRYNRILFPDRLKIFFKKLQQLRSSGQERVSILHFGDSHIQADFLSGQVRRNYQKEFGNAGRGLIIPAKLARTNGPDDVQSTSTVTWESKRMVFPDQPLPIGISGITISTEDSSALLEINLKKTDDFDYRANELTVFFRKDPGSFHISFLDSVNRSIAFAGAFTNEVPGSSSVSLPYPTEKFKIKALKTLPQQSRLTLYGVALSTKNSGIWYHAAGVNGAKYKHFSLPTKQLEQTPALHPDLIIISLGTNEALDFPFIDSELEDQIKIFTEGLRQYNPGTALLLTTPPGTFRKKNRTNPAVSKIRDRIIKFGEENGIPIFDMYGAGGGDAFASKWMKAGLMQKDGVHFTKSGYELQGDMLYLALTEAFNAYATH